MNPTITVALISASASILIASATFYFTKRSERAALLRQQKREHYHELLKAFATFYDSTAKVIEARQNLASAINMVALVAPQDVIAAVMAYYREMLVWPPRREEHERLQRALVMKLRASLELPFRDDATSFDFALIPVDSRVDSA